MAIDVRRAKPRFTVGIRDRAFSILLTVVVVLIASGGCGGRVAHDPRIRTSCALPSSDATQLTPRFVCTATDGNGERHAVFSYDNAGAASVTVPVGPTNLMFPAPLGRGQPTTFATGTKAGFFAVSMPEGSVTWMLGAASATALASGPTCGGDGGSSVEVAGRLIDLHQADVVSLDTAIVSSAATTEGSDLPPGQFRTTLGRTPGYFSTASDGGANYTVPLWVPDGRAGMQPSLSLSYSSTSSNGPLGVGFNLGGLSQIARCPRVLDRDEVSLAIQFDDSLATSIPGVPGIYHGDRLCLDGDPLVPVRDDGKHVVEFRTLHESFSQILVDGYDAMGPTSFTIRAKSGQTYRYGNRPESRLESLRLRLTTTDDDTVPIPNPYFNPLKPETDEDGVNPKLKGHTTRSIVTPHYEQPVRFSWAISDAADRSGNAMTYDYRITSTSLSDVCSTPSPECAAKGVQLLPMVIRYTSSVNLPATREVRFVWSPRPDVATRWVSGLKLAEGTRLSEVTMLGPNPLETRQLRSYLLAYELSPVSARSRLVSLTECDGSPVCKQPTQFGWANDAVARELKPVSTEPELDETVHSGDNLDDLFFNDLQFDPNGQTLVLDIDGDGYDDVLYRTRRDPVLDARGPGGVQTHPKSDVRRVAKYYYRLSTHGGHFGSMLSRVSG